MSKRLKVLLKNGHPHADEIGYIEVGEGDKINYFFPPGGNEKLFRIALEACKHGGDSCYAAQKDCVLLGVEE